MSEAKHTPGPWQRHGSHIYTADPERAILAQVFNPGKRPGDYPLTENANLIAAAPEMLDELEKQRNKHCFASSGVGECDTCRDKQNCSLRRVIKKARGEKDV